jgi:hypothetical protein
MNSNPPKKADLISLFVAGSRFDLRDLLQDICMIGCGKENNFQNSRKV